MNIIQIRDRLKGVADSDLVNYVKNPTADVPSFVALSEIKRRKDDRDAYQARANETVFENGYLYAGHELLLNGLS